MPAVDDLDPDRATIHVVDARPARDAGMPGAHFLIDKPEHIAVLLDNIMR